MKWMGWDWHSLQRCPMSKFLTIVAAMREEASHYEDRD